MNKISLNVQLADSSVWLGSCCLLHLNVFLGYYLYMIIYLYDLLLSNLEINFKTL